MRLFYKKMQNLSWLLLFCIIKKSDGNLFWHRIRANHELKIYCANYGSNSLKNLFYVHRWLRNEIIESLVRYEEKTEDSLLACEEVIKEVLSQRVAYFGKAEQKEIQNVLQHLVTQNFEYN